MSSSCAAYHTAVHFGFGCMFCTFQLTIVCITCSKKLTGSQLSLPHGIQQEMKPCVMGSHQPRRVATLLRTNEILQCWLSVKILATTYMVVHNMSPGQVFDLLTYTRTHADKHVENNIPAFAIADGNKSWALVLLRASYGIALQWSTSWQRVTSIVISTAFGTT